MVGISTKRGRNGRFMKKKAAERQEETSMQMKSINEKRREQRERQEENCSDVGRRIVDIALLAELLWCNLCEKPLSLRDIQSEEANGLASVFKIKCVHCLDVYTIPTSKTDRGIVGYPLFTVNLRAAMGITDSGCGLDQFNKCLSAMNVPTLSHPAFKRSEKRIARAVDAELSESCKKAILEEKAMSQEAQLEQDQNSEEFKNADSASSSDAGDTLTPVVVSFDFQWFRRGNGREYNSLTGQGNVVGHKTKKILAVEVRSKCCALCARGHSPGDHECSRNYSGSAKGMEPDTAVHLISKNAAMHDAGVRVGTLIGDDDSATISAVRRESNSPIVKWSDRNHASRGFTSKLYTVMLKGKHSNFSKKGIDYLKKCFCCALDQNKGNPDGLRENLKNIVPHSFGEHQHCGSWCRAKSVSDYVYKDLPRGKPFTGEGLRRDLERVFNMYAERAESLAPGGSSQLNESFNQMCTTKAPKSRHYGASKALELRVKTAALQKNEGFTHILGIAEKAFLSPSNQAQKYRERLQEQLKRRRLLQASNAVKRKRLFHKQKRKQGETGSTRREGFSYHSGMAENIELLADFEPPPRSASCPSAPPSTTPAVPVLVDIETCGLSPTADIIQLAAKCAENSFNTYMLPAGNISEEVRRLTGFDKVNGMLLYKEERIPTTTPRLAASQFIDFLRACGSPVVLVGHNIIRFDGPRIMGWCQKHAVLEDLKNVVVGLSDTMKLLGKGEASKKQDTLARKYLSAEWQTVLENAHNAKVDCEILEAILKVRNISSADLIDNSVTLTKLAEDSLQKARKKANVASLQLLTGAVSATMIGKIATAGITFENLREVFQKAGQDGVKFLLGQNVGGKVRVTSTGRIINNVVKFLEEYDKENNQ